MTTIVPVSDSPPKITINSSSPHPAVGESTRRDAPGLLVPSPLPTRRTRTLSQSERARDGPTHYGRVVSFCRQRGHGFIAPNDEKEPLFLHISDIDSELVPVEGDEVSYKLCPLPPKFEKMSAVHVIITRAKEGVTHERWTEGHITPRTD